MPQGNALRASWRGLEVKKILFTIGYGNQKPEDFLARLKDTDIDLVIDVRYYERARLGCYQATGYEDRGMAAFLAGKFEEPIADAIEYIWCQELGKPKEMSLDDYVCDVLEAENGKKFLDLCKWHIQRRKKVCILCCEGDAYEYDTEAWKSRGKTRCHRAYVADALAALLGDAWEVQHV